MNVDMINLALFQSSPGQKAGCNGPQPQLEPLPGIVSILTRPEGRVQRSGSGSGGASPGFQSSPGQKAGCNNGDQFLAGDTTGFNPHPARRPGATRGSPLASSRSGNSFNPHPARRPGATPVSVRIAGVCCCFNPHPARRPGATAVCRPARVGEIPVSILTRPEGRVQPYTGAVGNHQSRFQSSPGQKAGCNL